MFVLSFRFLYRLKERETEKPAWKSEFIKRNRFGFQAFGPRLIGLDKAILKGWNAWG